MEVDRGVWVGAPWCRSGSRRAGVGQGVRPRALPLECVEPACVDSWWPGATRVMAAEVFHLEPGEGESPGLQSGQTGALHLQWNK